MNQIDQVRTDYDCIAAEYARRLFHEFEGKPRDRELLLRFAAEVTGSGQVCDMGCGPGHVARFLGDAGARVMGLDLSPEMLAMARRLSPDIEFRTGNMLALDLPDNTLAGITAFYAIVNIDAGSLPTAFREMHRVLQPGGMLLLAFHIGGDVIRPEELWGQKVAMEFYHFDRALIERLLSNAGFRIEDVVEREPYAPGGRVPEPPSLHLRAQDGDCSGITPSTAVALLLLARAAVMPRPFSCTGGVDVISRRGTAVLRRIAAHIG